MISPTGYNKIRSDSEGSGYYGASRKNRMHIGVDYRWKDFDNDALVFAPITGRITRVAKPYANKKFSGVEIIGKDMTLKMFYFEPDLELIGMIVDEGDAIGIGQDIRSLHGENMTPHIHIEVISFNFDVLLNY